MQNWMQAKSQFALSKEDYVQFSLVVQEHILDTRKQVLQRDGPFLDSSLLRNAVGMMDLISQINCSTWCKEEFPCLGGVKTGNLWDDFCLNNEGK